ncbi:MAG: acylneuraminate cytidylyltransferase family protein [Gammaproteobacteria bacterium]
MKDTLAVIPARGGSRGIPRKNLVKVAGKPLVVHSIEHARAARCVERVIVSTDDAEIAAVARAAGAEVPFLRPAGLAGDTVLDHPVFVHVLEHLAQAERYVPGLVLHLRPTAPHRLPGWIDAAAALLRDDPRADSVRSVSPPAQHPYRMFRIDAEGYLDPLYQHEHPMPYLLRRQDLPPMWYYNCVIDVTRPRTILDKGSMTGDRILPYKMSADDVVDVDGPRDLQLARLLMEGAR